MPIELKMPALSPTMEKGNLAKWLKKEGDAIKSGDVIAEIETDKATMEYESADEGILGKIVVPEGTEDVAVGTLIGVILEEGESAVDIKAAAPPSPQPSPSREREPVEAAATSPLSAAGRGQGEGPSPSAAETRPAAAFISHGGRVIASPLARRVAAQKGLDLAAIKGTGPHGRIVLRDLDGAHAAPAKPAPAAAASTQAAAAPATPADAPFEDEKLSSMRKVIAKRLTESKQTIPHYYLSVDIELDKLLALRKDVNAASPVKVSVNDFLIKALAVALERYPDANVQFLGDTLRRFKRADISVAVAIPGGLITPVIRDAARKSLSAISTEMKSLAEKARSGKLLPEDYAGGTFSLSNLGMYGIKEFSAVINPPQAGILAVGSGDLRPVVKNGQIVPATLMSATMSYDHRAIDGAVGAEFLSKVKELLENPLGMLI